MPSFIEIHSLSKNFIQGRQAIPVLQDISLSIAQGDVFGIIGLSGAGKSTLIRCLSRLILPTSGQVLFSGQDIATLNKASLHDFQKKMGMIFQHFNLLSSRTVEENIAYPLEIAHVPKEKQRERIDELLKMVHLEKKRKAYPSQLSGGEKQRVGIARALANHPQVLLCDEATSALDPKTTREILSLLKGIRKTLGVTIVLITHEMEVIKQICNKVAVLDSGKIVEQGLVSEVFSAPQHPITQHFLQNTSHEIPAEFFHPLSPNRKLLRLHFKGKAANEPIISEIIKTCDVHANILLGWLDRLDTLTMGTLVIELSGPIEGIAKALRYLSEKSVQYEVLEHDRR